MIYMKVENIVWDEKKFKEQKKKNFEQRLKFVRFWADYVKNNSNEKWSKQQNIVIDDQIE